MGLGRRRQICVETSGEAAILNPGVWGAGDCQGRPARCAEVARRRGAKPVSGAGCTSRPAEGAEEATEPRHRGRSGARSVTSTPLCYGAGPTQVPNASLIHPSACQRRKVPTPVIRAGRMARPDVDTANPPTTSSTQHRNTEHGLRTDCRIHSLGFGTSWLLLPSPASRITTAANP